MSNKQKEDKIQKNFLREYPNADMSKFEIISFPNKNETNVYFGAWSIFGDSPDDFDNFSEPNKSKLIAALGVKNQNFHKLF